jgi:uncharacterized coiled-coil DUF342 family protein
MSKPTARWIEYWTARLSTLIETEIAEVKTVNAAALDGIESAAQKQALKELGVQKQYEKVHELAQEAEKIAKEITSIQSDASETVGKIDGLKTKNNNHGYSRTRSLNEFTVGFGGGRYSNNTTVDWTHWAGVATAYNRTYDAELNKTPWGQRITTLKNEKLRINDTIMLAASDAELRDKITMILNHLGISTTELQDALDG